MTDHCIHCWRDEEGNPSQCCPGSHAFQGHGWALTWSVCIVCLELEHERARGVL